MPHDFPLITTISSALGLSLILGFFANRLKLPALVGYILAGILIGPFTPGFVANSKIAAELAEIGIMLLMFGVGLHFSLDDLLKVKKNCRPRCFTSNNFCHDHGSNSCSILGLEFKRSTHLWSIPICGKHRCAFEGHGKKWLTSDN